MISTFLFIFFVLVLLNLIRLQKGSSLIVSNATRYSTPSEITESIPQSGFEVILDKLCSVTFPHAARVEGIGLGKRPKIGFSQKVLVVDATH